MPIDPSSPRGREIIERSIRADLQQENAAQIEDLRNKLCEAEAAKRDYVAHIVELTRHAIELAASRDAAKAKVVELEAEISELKEMPICDLRCAAPQMEVELQIARAKSEKMQVALELMKKRDEENGSLPPAYRMIIEAALAECGGAA